MLGIMYEDYLLNYWLISGGYDMVNMIWDRKWNENGTYNEDKKYRHFYLGSRTIGYKKYDK